MNMFTKAAQGFNLTPAERAFLKLFKLWFYTALSTGVMAGAQYLLNNQQVNWTALLYIAGGAFLLSLLGALDKYWTAQGDVPLTMLTQAAEQRVQMYAAPPMISTPLRVPQVQQVPFPPVSTVTQSFMPPSTSQAISFGDTGLTPALPKP